MWVLQRAVYVTASVRTHKIRFIGATPTYHFVTPSLPSYIPLCSADGSIGTGEILGTLQRAANTNQVQMLGIECI